MSGVIISRWAKWEGRRRMLIYAGTRSFFSDHLFQGGTRAGKVRPDKTRLDRCVAYGTRRWMNSSGPDFWDGHVAYLRHPRLQQEVYLVGSVHISKRSVEIVREVIQTVRPDAVMVELCEARKQTVVAIDNGQQSSMLDAILKMAGIQREQARALVGDNILEFIDSYTRGNEMLAAIRAAEQVGAKVILGDRDQNTTMRRLKEEFNLSDVVRLFTTQVAKSVFSNPFAHRHSISNITRHEVRQVLQSLRESCSPGFVSALVDERDEIMAQTLANCHYPRVVAVVGMAHMDGIEKRYQDEGLLMNEPIN
eukprot:768463-Hanusia_phi.AAC.4